MAEGAALTGGSSNEHPAAGLRPDGINRILGGVAPAFALLAGLELDLFSCIGDDTRLLPDIAIDLEVDPLRLQRLLDALVLVGLLEKQGEAYRNSREARAFLVRDAPESMAGEHELLRLLWQADLCTAASIRSGLPAAEHDFSGSSEDAAAFQRGLLPSTLRFGHELADAVAIGQTDSGLDIGGGPAGALLALAELLPHARLTLLELPAVATIVAPIIATSPHGGRVRIETGDIVAGPAAQDHDVAILKAVVQVLAPFQAAAAIRNCFASLKPGGTLAIGGAGMLDDEGMSPPSAVFYNLTFMNLYRHGASYTRSQYLAWLAQAGFTEARFLTLRSGGTVLCARRP
ncbi:methyltransferase [Nostoc sp. NIES-2111]